MKTLLKDYRIMVLITLLTLSAISLLTPHLIKKSGVYVSYVSSNAKCDNIKVGDRITDINGISIESLRDFYDALKNIKKGDYVPIVSNGMPAHCIALNNSNLGFLVKEVKPSSLRFGIDIQGGTKVILEPEEKNVSLKTINDIVTILTERINMYGLSDIRVIPIGSRLIEIEAAGLTADDIKNFLAKQGVFEGKIMEKIELVNHKGYIIFDGKKYPIYLNDSKIIFNNNSYFANESFRIDDVKFEIYNFTDNYIILFADVFTGKDIINIYTDPQHNYIAPAGNGYRFAFVIRISKESAERFAKITKGQPVYIIGGESYIKPKIVLFLDNKPLSQLNIAAGLAGEAVDTPSIEGWGKTAEDARKEKLRLQTILRSGSLPVKLKIVRADTITQTAGKRMLDSTIYVIIAGAIAVSLIVFIRYRNVKIFLPIIALSLSEIVIILGIASSRFIAGLTLLSALFIGFYYREIKSLIHWLMLILIVIIAGYVVIAPWTLDVPAIAGLIGVLGSSSNQMIIITDEILLDREKELKERHKTAMEMINNSAALITFAMTPLVFLGIGTLRGFAITTVVGVLVGLFITRTAYMSIIERYARKILHS